MAAGLRELVRDKVRAGELPRDYVKLWAGPGTATPCKGCGIPTRVSGIEFEMLVADGRDVIICKPCFIIWGQERGVA
jgi:hypothetical protein